MELDVLKPILITLIDPSEEVISEEEISKAVSIIESWMVRRLLVRATNKNYNKLVVEMINVVNRNRKKAAMQLQKFFSDQNSVSGYWPDDNEIEKYVAIMPIYRNLYRSRIRMILEAVEDFERGWNDEKPSKSGVRVSRGSYAIEHVMPQKWQTNWPLGEYTEEERDLLVQTIGNLTLVTKRLNSSLSNDAWQKKRLELNNHDVLLLNKKIQDLGQAHWDEELIKARTKKILEKILLIWPVPEGHKSRIVREQVDQKFKVRVIDLISAGLVSPGQTIYAKAGRFSGHTAQILDDGRIEVNGVVCNSLSGAGKQLLKRSNNGWVFWRVDQKAQKPMADLWEEYRELIGLEDGEDDSQDDDN
jgi:hypothetical protein